jgi:hypothetical protein
MPNAHRFVTVTTIALAPLFASATAVKADVAPPAFRSDLECAPGDPAIGNHGITCDIAEGENFTHAAAGFALNQSVFSRAEVSTTEALSSFAKSSLTYFFFVSGPGTSVTIDITSSGSAGGASVAQLLDPGGGHSACGDGVDLCTILNGPRSWGAVDHFTAQPGLDYEVQLLTEAVAGGSSAGLSTDEPTSFASIDPFIFIDPSTPNAALWSIAFSPGITNNPPRPGTVPEPASWTMLVLGAAGFWNLRTANRYGHPPTRRAARVDLPTRGR